MKQATDMHDAYDPVLLPGITVNTSPTNSFDPGDAVAEVERQDVGAVRRDHRRDELIIELS